ncbi:MAG: radical SAM protein [Caldilineae bacterium]|nr:MAG: radical SAM protein [Caldilineae bacterium]
MERVPIPLPYSAGLFLTYKCNCACKHCLYACSARWPAEWITEEDAEQILRHLARAMRGRYLHPDRVGVNDGLHLTGGEPFLNFDLLLRLTEIAARLGIPALFVETNAFWCRDDVTTREKMKTLREAGLQGILISANPFLLERIPFERTERATRIAREIFGANAIVYQEFFFRQFRDMGLSGTLSFEEYVQRAGYGLRFAELLPGGRVPFALSHLFRRYPASHFFGASCRVELLREWHVHVDNYGNFIPGFCGGISLGDARDLPTLCEGIDLARRPVLQALLTDLEELYRLGVANGYRPRDGYVSKCHLCLDIRRHLARRGGFPELQPTRFYDQLEAGLGAST